MTDRSIALFIDVDETLIDGHVQEAYATQLGCEDEYRDLEHRFERRHVDEEAFGVELVALFRSRGFTATQASAWAATVELRPYAENLLCLPMAVYLVSSGPDYYLKELARKHPQIAGFASSRYHFSEDGLISSCEPMDRHGKAGFVEELLPMHRFSIGAGDSIDLDGAFVGWCDLGVLVRRQGAAEEESEIPFLLSDGLGPLLRTAESVLHRLGPGF